MGHFLGAARGIPDFAIYVFTGLTAYSLFSEILSGATSSIVGNSGLIKKIYVPREVFPLASVGSAIFNFLIQLAVLLAATILLGRLPVHVDILFFFPAVAVLLVYGTALGLLLSAVNVYLRDIQYLIEVILMVLLWGSPIVYSWSMVKETLGNSLLLDLYTNNPISLAVLGFQRAFWLGGEGAEFPSVLLLRLVIATVVGLVAVVLCHRVFARLQGFFALEL
jgi:ABC-2 type transport system permease protein